ncbi:MAG TPA: acyl-CoA dehydrogenase family protein, partial [Gammaproteobacteria bacterium]|nr:acyl-CoA dehydrogenase family protein [Gammaproteobacteria bacterium]
PSNTKNIGASADETADTVPLMSFERRERERTVVDHTLTGVRPIRQAILDLSADVRQRADAAEKARQVPAETMASLRKAGLFRAFVPRVYGGDERSLTEVLDAMTELAAACPSTAWVGTLFAMHNIAACWLEKKGQDEIFGDGPDVLVASSVAPIGALAPVDGGFRLAGKWSFSSGVEHASWIIVGATLKSESPSAPPDYVFCFVRASDVSVVDDWHVAGLRATGSKSVELNDVLIPRHRVVLLKTVQDGTAPGLAIHRQPFYRLPWYPVFICAFPAVGLGAALAMLEGFRAHIRARVDSFSGIAFQTTSGSAVRMAAAAAELDAARLVFRRDVAALDRAAQEDRPLRPGESERIMYDAPFIMDVCSRAALELLRGSGGKVLYEANPLQRHFRDIHAMTQHVAMDLDRAGETYGRLLFHNAELALGARDTPHKT